MKTVLLAFLALLLFSVNVSAQMLWDKTFGSANSYQLLSRMIPLSSGGYLLAGRQQTTPVNMTGYAVSTNSNGDTIWTRKFKPVGTDFCIIHDAAQDADGNIVLVGAGHSGNLNDFDGFILKLNANGDTIWTKRIITPQQDVYYSVIIGNDGSYVIAGAEAGANIVKKVSKNGALVWVKPFSYSSTSAGHISNISRTQNGYLIFIGNQNISPPGGKSININESGIEQINFYNSVLNVFDYTPTANGGLLALGDNLLYEFKPSGDTLWSKRYKIGTRFISLFGIKATTDGNYIAVFNRSNGQDGDVGLIKITSNGAVIKDTVLYRFGYYEDGMDIAVDANGDYVFAGYAQVLSGNRHFFLAKHRMWLKTLGIKENQEIISSIKLYPNPATEHTIIESEKPLTGTYSLYNLQGQKLWQEKISKSTQKVVPLQNLSAGIYIIRFVSEDGIQFSRKLIKQ